MKKVLLTATVQSHIAQFHKPLIDMLHDNNYIVHVAARNNLSDKNGLKLENPDRIFDLPFDRYPFGINNIKAYIELKKIIKDNNYDIISCNTPVGGVLTRLAARSARKNGARVFYTAHGFHFYKGASLKNWIIFFPIEKYMTHFTDKLITITKEDYQFAKKHFKTNVEYINGVGANSQRFFPISDEMKKNLRNELGYEQNRFILLCTGELNKNKNQSVVIESINCLTKDIPNILLLLAGNGPMENKLKDLVSSLNINNNVCFLGYRTDLEKYVNICDVVISASHREGLPLNILEGMLCGKPIIASRNRGHNELVNPYENGFLVEASSSIQFSDAITKLYTNLDMRIMMKEKSLEMAKKYSIDSVIKKIVRIYDL